MRTTSPASRLGRLLAVREWRWWQLPPLARVYVAIVPLGAVAVMGIEAIGQAGWPISDVSKFLLLMSCGMVSVASMPRLMYSPGGVTRDFSSVWMLPTAILLPPVYTALVPIPLYAISQIFVHRGVVHRTVFSAAAVSLSYALAAEVFRLFPSSFAGRGIGSGLHAFSWAVAVAACEIVGGRSQRCLVLGAVKLTDPTVRIRRIEWNREALEGIFAEIDLGVLITVAMGLSPALVVLAVPAVLLVRRFMVHPALMAQSRVDSKTGLLNISTWEKEAEAELSRATRTRGPIAVALVDIDHFKGVNDTYGHLAGDRVLKAVAEALTGQLRDYDLAGRFGGEEFVLLLARATEDEALRIAERLRCHIGGMAVPASDDPGAARVSLTISVGVTAGEPGRGRKLADMLAAADSALYQAKRTGRNRVSVAGRDASGQLQRETMAFSACW